MTGTGSTPKLVEIFFAGSYYFLRLSKAEVHLQISGSSTESRWWAGFFSGSHFRRAVLTPGLYSGTDSREVRRASTQFLAQSRRRRNNSARIRGCRHRPSERRRLEHRFGRRAAAILRPLCWTVDHTRAAVKGVCHGRRPTGSRWSSAAAAHRSRAWSAQRASAPANEPRRIDLFITTDSGAVPLLICPRLVAGATSTLVIAKKLSPSIAATRHRAAKKSPTRNWSVGSGPQRSGSAA